MTVDKVFRGVYDQVGELTPEQTGELVGRLLALTTIDRNTVEALLKQLSDDDKAEFGMQVEALLAEDEA